MVTEKKSNALVIKLSGSLFFSKEFDSVAKTLRNWKGLSSSLVLVAGGGAAARRYIEAGERFGADKSSLDEIGIAISRLNATVLRLALGKVALDYVPTTLSQVVDAIQLSPKVRIVVCGGLHPGQSTNAVAALIAEKIRASHFINATDVEYVYDKDPKRYKDAKALKIVSTKLLEEILGSESFMPGGYDLMDPVALKIISRSKIDTRIVKCNAQTLKDVLSGKQKGTRITF